jgi:hypothetical protein
LPFLRERDRRGSKNRTSQFRAAGPEYPMLGRRMSERIGEAVLAGQALILLLPATLLVGFLIFISYAAYPLQHASPWQAAFDVAMLIVLAAVAAAWRLVVVRLRAGRASLGRVHSAWFITAVLGALVGLLGAVVAVEHPPRRWCRPWDSSPGSDDRCEAQTKRAACWRPSSSSSSSDFPLVF